MHGADSGSHVSCFQASGQLHLDLSCCPNTRRLNRTIPANNKSSIYFRELNENLMNIGIGNSPELILMTMEMIRN